MATDYEKFYRENRNGLGEPTKNFVAFFDAYQREGSKILDVGCGQGRDALFIARRGHFVSAIDLSPSGVRDLLSDAASEGLNIEAEVADIRDFKWTRFTRFAFNFNRLWPFDFQGRSRRSAIPLAAVQFIDGDFSNRHNTEACFVS